MTSVPKIQVPYPCTGKKNRAGKEDYRFARSREVSSGTGIFVFGSYDQGDCNALCTKVNMPCRGCGGPIPGIKDYGAKAISAIGSMLKTPDMAGDLKKRLTMT